MHEVSHRPIIVSKVRFIRATDIQTNSFDQQRSELVSSVFYRQVVLALIDVFLEAISLKPEFALADVR